MSPDTGFHIKGDAQQRASLPGTRSSPPAQGHAAGLPAASGRGRHLTHARVISVNRGCETEVGGWGEGEVEVRIKGDTATTEQSRTRQELFIRCCKKRNDHFLVITKSDEFYVVSTVLVFPFICVNISLFTFLFKR